MIEGVSVRQVRLCRVLIIGILCGCSLGHAQAMRENPAEEREIGVTIDDLPLNGPRFDLKRLQTMTGRLLSVINKNQIPVVGFVNESLLYVPSETDARIALLKAWSDAALALTHHTFPHSHFTFTYLR